MDNKVGGNLAGPLGSKDGAKSSWQLITSGVLLGSIPRPRLLMPLFTMWTIQLSVCSACPFQCKLFYGYFHLGIHKIGRGWAQADVRHSKCVSSPCL